MKDFRRAELRTRAERGADRGARQALEILRRAAGRRVPVDTGRLAASARIVTEGKTGSLGYTAPYAAHQHARMERRGAGYLAGPVRDAAVRRQMAQALAAALRRELK